MHDDESQLPERENEPTNNNAREQMYCTENAHLRTEEEVVQRVASQRTSPIVECKRRKAESLLTTSLLNSHYLEGTENDPYYICRYCFSHIRNTHVKYIKHNAVCLNKKKKKDVV